MSEGALYAAVASGDVEKVRELLSGTGRAEISARHSDSGETVLHAVMRTGNLEIFDLLLPHCSLADLIASDDRLASPLDVAVRQWYAARRRNKKGRQLLG